MGTNYYATLGVETRCESCGHHSEPDRLHIGKSSLGWCFSLHVIPELGLTDWPEWEAFLTRQGVTITDEYKAEIDLRELIAVVTERSMPPKNDRWWEFGNYYRDEADFHRQNHSFMGPNNLLRHKVDGTHCIGNGEGTWDLIAGAFS